MVIFHLICLNFYFNLQVVHTERSEPTVLNLSYSYILRLFSFNSRTDRKQEIKRFPLLCSCIKTKQYRGADKSLARQGSKHAAPIKIVISMD